MVLLGCCLQRRLSIVVDDASESQVMPIAIADFELPHAVIKVGDLFRDGEGSCFMNRYAGRIECRLNVGPSGST